MVTKDRIEHCKTLSWKQLGFTDGLRSSPFRKDSKPSLSLYYKDGKSFYKDHATGERGSIIDFVMKLQGLTFQNAVIYIESLLQGKTVQHEQHSHIDTIPVQKAVMNYRFLSDNTEAMVYLLNARGIKAEALAEVSFETMIVNFKGYANKYITFPVASGSFECRAIDENNPVKQLKIGPAALWIHGKGSGNVVVSESIIDALSWRSLFFSVSSEDETLISLNSVANYRKLVDFDFTGREVQLCLDNDPAGDLATRHIVKMLQEKEVAAKDVREILKGLKDLNELLLASKS